MGQKIVVDANMSIYLHGSPLDAPKIKSLNGRLNEESIKSWSVLANLKPGQVADQEIEQELSNSDILMIVLSKNSENDIDQIRNTVSLFRGFHNKANHIIPVRIEDCEVPSVKISGFGLNLCDVSPVDFFKETGFGDLLSTINRVRNDNNPPKERPTNNSTTSFFPEREHSSIGWEKSAIITISILCIIGLPLFALAVPHPSEWQLYVFRTLLALGVGAIGSLIPGLFEIKFRKTIRAAGGLGLFAMVYLINPPALLLDTDTPVQEEILDDDAVEKPLDGLK